MSATNRGSTRKPHDFYPTPIPTIETFLDVFPLRGGIEVLEPGAGSGNIIKTLQKYGDFRSTRWRSDRRRHNTCRISASM